MHKVLNIAGKSIEIFSEVTAAASLIVFNAFEEEMPQDILTSIKQHTMQEFSLAVIKNIDWNLEMSPWPEPSLFKKEVAFGGGADAYLNVLETEILPAIKDALPAAPSVCILGGYSMAGLFALYAGMHSQQFNGIMAASASLWYIDFLEYAVEHKFADNVQCVYYSLGDKESKTRQKIMATVQERTEAMLQLTKEQGITTTLEMNSGNHFQNVYERIGKGLAWVLEHDK